MQPQFESRVALFGSVEGLWHGINRSGAAVVAVLWLLLSSGCAGNRDNLKLPPSAVRSPTTQQPQPIKPPPRTGAGRVPSTSTAPAPKTPATSKPPAPPVAVAGTRPLAAPAPVVPAEKRSGITASLDLAYTRMAVDGDLSLAPASGASGAPQDIDSAFGLGDDRQSPLLRAGVDFGLIELGASAFWLSESGQGVLGQSFGGIGAATSVAADLDLAVAKLTAAAAFDVGAFTIAPGVLLDVFDVEFTARELTLGNREEIDELLVVPMPFVRLGASYGDFDFGLEGGFLSISRSGGSKGQFSDLEANVRWTARPGWHVLAGYRRLGIDAEGNSGADNIEIDLSLSGWFLGGGLQF